MANKRFGLDQPRRPWELHGTDCTCCNEDPAQLDVGGMAWRVLLGFGWGSLIILALDAAGIGGGIGVLFGGVAG